ncbi:hypothetical protein Hanom_Chr00s064267g01786361 [Helianthus anomalus]
MHSGIKFKKTNMNNTVLNACICVHICICRLYLYLSLSTLIQCSFGNHEHVYLDVFKVMCVCGSRQCF